MIQLFLIHLSECIESNKEIKALSYVLDVNNLEFSSHDRVSDILCLEPLSHATPQALVIVITLLYLDFFP